MANEKLSILIAAIDKTKKSFSEVKKSLTGLDKKTAATSKSMKGKMTAAFASMSQKAKAATDSMKKNWLAFTAAIAGAILILRKVTGIIKGWIRLAAIQEDAEFSLAVALKKTGLATKENITELTNYASALQSVSGIGDETIIGVQKLLATFGMNVEQLKRSTRATLDLSVAQGIDLRAAALLLGKAFVGETGALSRYGIVIDQSIPQNEKFAAVMQVLEDRFGGFAAMLGDTFTGQQNKATSAIGDFLEELGFFITKNPAVIAALQDITITMGDLAASFKKAREQGEGLFGVMQKIGEIIKFLSGLIKQVFLQAIGAVTGPVFALARGLNAIRTQLTGFKKLTKETAEGLDAIGDSAEGAAKKVVSASASVSGDVSEDIGGEGIGIGGGGIAADGMSRVAFASGGRAPSKKRSLSAEALQSLIDRSILPSHIKKLRGGQTVTGFKSGMQFVGVKPPTITPFSNERQTSFDLTGKNIREMNFAVTIEGMGSDWLAGLTQELFNRIMLKAKEQGTRILTPVLP
jgi:hypothetical protein